MYEYAHQKEKRKKNIRHDKYPCLCAQTDIFIHLNAGSNFLGGVSTIVSRASRHADRSFSFPPTTRLITYWFWPNVHRSVFHERAVRRRRHLEEPKGGGGRRDAWRPVNTAYQLLFLSLGPGSCPDTGTTDRSVKLHIITHPACLCMNSISVPGSGGFLSVPHLSGLWSNSLNTVRTHTHN